MHYMKQVDGIPMLPALSIRPIRSSFVEVATTMLPMQEYSTSTTTMDTVAAAAASVYVSQCSNVISVIWAIQNSEITLGINSKDR